MSRFSVDKIRNFSIIAHVDHGKSTLADKLLEITFVNLSSRWCSNSSLSSLPQLPFTPSLCNIYYLVELTNLQQMNTQTFTAQDLLECEGRVDFNYEVSRSLAACQGVILLVDANQAEIDMSRFSVDKIRNFSIIAHVDHGKSTLADRLLEITGTISQNQKNAQVLDKLQVEKERGITVKAQTASLFYDYNAETYLLNLIDTPGHVDFNYEVSRSLAACQGVILLVDANQGVQAQTMANFYLAFEAGLTIIPVLNKIDLPNAKPEDCKMQMNKLFNIKGEDILKVSAKHGTGVEELLQIIIEKIPPPSYCDPGSPLKALVFDSWYDKYRGAVANLAIRDGCIQKGEKITTSFTKKVYEVTEVGIHHPNETPVDILYSGQVGYIMANMKNVSEAQVGDTIFNPKHPVEPFKGFKPAKAMVYAGIFPTNQSEYPALQTAIKKLTLNDSSVSLFPDMSPALGAGWRVGFLGLLHMDVFNQRLEQEFDASVIVTAPNVPYKGFQCISGFGCGRQQTGRLGDVIPSHNVVHQVKIMGAKNIKKYKGEEVTILNPCDMPSEDNITEYFEPMVNATIILPDDYLDGVTKLCEDSRGTIKDQDYIDEKRILMKVIFPLNEILIDFFDNLKCLTSGYASFDYEDHGYQSSDLMKLTFLLNGIGVDELTMLVHKSKAREIAKNVCAKLKDAIPKQMFLIVIQAAHRTNIIAREEIKPFRKDVTAKCYGGDITRKAKLIRAQALGKKRMREIGKVSVPKDAFVKVLKRT